MSTGLRRERHAATHTREALSASEGREGRVLTSYPRRPACASAPTRATCGLCGDEIQTSRDVWTYCHGRPEHTDCHALECAERVEDDPTSRSGHPDRGRGTPTPAKSTVCIKGCTEVLR